jgi:hypothetical protein
MALESTQPLTEKSTSNLPWGKGRPAREADNFTAICEPIVYKMWEPRRFKTLWAFTASYRDSFTFTFFSNSPIVPWTLCSLRYWQDHKINHKKEDERRAQLITAVSLHYSGQSVTECCRNISSSSRFAQFCYFGSSMICTTPSLRMCFISATEAIKQNHDFITLSVCLTHNRSCFILTAWRTIYYLSCFAWKYNLMLHISIMGWLN